MGTSELERRHFARSDSRCALSEEIELPDNLTQPRGIGFVARAKVDSDHASDSVARRSRASFANLLMLKEEERC